MPTIRIAGVDEDSHLPCECRRVDEHQRTRERVRGLAELSPEQRSYDVQQAIRDGRMSAYRDELDWRENHEHMGVGVKLSLAAAACFGLVGFLCAFLAR